ncbi:MAG: hypothetical protein QNJ97_07270 [Myxococcota bacterium]|nr:hypothetical protein [Myxococcota bacterium]
MGRCLISTVQNNDRGTRETLVIPAQAGIQVKGNLDSRLRGMTVFFNDFKVHMSSSELFWTSMMSDKKATAFIVWGMFILDIKHK